MANSRRDQEGNKYAIKPHHLCPDSPQSDSIRPGPLRVDPVHPGAQTTSCTTSTTTADSNDGNHLLVNVAQTPLRPRQPRRTKASSLPHGRALSRPSSARKEPHVERAPPNIALTSRGPCGDQTSDDAPDPAAAAAAHAADGTPTRQPRWTGTRIHSQGGISVLAPIGKGPARGHHIISSPNNSHIHHEKRHAPDSDSFLIRPKVFSLYNASRATSGRPPGQPSSFPAAPPPPPTSETLEVES